MLGSAGNPDDSRLAAVGDLQHLNDAPLGGDLVALGAHRFTPRRVFHASSERLTVTVQPSFVMYTPTVPPDAR